MPICSAEIPERNLLTVISCRSFWGLLLTASAVFGQPALREPEERVIHYHSSGDLADPVSILGNRMGTGGVKLEFEPAHGYLVSLLKLLQVPVSSQGLVFSKTSLLTDLVGPATPRAVYFNDNVYISWVPGAGVIDVSAVDPNKGPIFYTLDQQPASPPRFIRPNECMQCHIGPRTLGVPGHLLRSVVTAADGYPLHQVDGFINGHGSPFKDRWGGWYVSGTLAGDVHRGRSLLVDRDPHLDASRYLSPESDIVALMVLAHQTKMHNLITRANYEAHFALDPGMSAQNTAWAHQRIANAAEPLIEYMLFRDEAALHGPVSGASRFAEEFQQRGPRDSRGRSLHELDLQTRLMRYPCSYLIYSPAFDALPAVMKNYLWRRLSKILRGDDQSKAYATMSRRDREAVLSILRETKPEFAAWLSQTREESVR